MDKKKMIPIALACCLLLAAVIFFTTRSENLTSIPDLKGEMTWVKCNNPACGISYEMAMRDYYQLVDTKQRETGSVSPPIACKKCGEESIFRAVKCEKCQAVFLYVFGGIEDYADRCPKCGFSKLEEASKKSPTK
jgi:predicted RNA-binding Zn-ribbon protein involved in translation (DUF1610 family)